MVRDHFAILKVGPALTFAFREAVFALAMIENELIAHDQRSNIIQILDEVMVKHPEHWKGYYHGTKEELIFKRKYSLSDRVRYYWVWYEVQKALKRLLMNLGNNVLPYSLLRQFVGDIGLTAAQVITMKIGRILENYFVSSNNIA
jgi:D-tagatose-1,6-bisphosphate aldolase subunit GatZ/KbaZ